MIKSIIVLVSVMFELLGCVCLGYGYFWTDEAKVSQVLTVIGVAILFLGIGATISSTVC